MSALKSTKRYKSGAHLNHDSGPVSLEVFTDFLLSRAYDIISEGRYRKHFIAGKDVGHMWAISMQESIAKVRPLYSQIVHALHKTHYAKQHR
jgi:hypothetical protein